MQQTLGQMVIKVGSSHFKCQMSLMFVTATNWGQCDTTCEGCHIVEDPNRSLRCSHTLQTYHSRHFRTMIVWSLKVIGESAQAQG